ncbi:MMPL family transporter [Streptomyces sp. NBC_01298]|uniref:MMPL family transporter n=1 Tax=Streptomyces sp. NBC_01298 TaxID=2903817 RepID=UPI002E125A26|nr:MMPL family transporter [Streptomyces sp. NBC_01298]
MLTVKWIRGNPWRVLALVSVLGLALLPAVIGCSSRLTPSGFTATGTESDRADRVIEEEFDQPSADLMFLVSGRTSMKYGEMAAQGRALARAAADQPGVARVWSYWDTALPALLSRDEHAALIGVELTGSGVQAVNTAQRIVPRLAGTHGGVSVAVAGPVWSNAEAVRLSREDLRRAEMAAAPFVLVILMVTLRSAALALLPMVIAVVSITATLAVLNGLTLVMPVSVFAVNVTAALGFGLSVDYGLLVLMRCREEMARGAEVADAVVMAVRSAGHAVLFSAATVIACLAALLVFPVPFLRSLAAGGIAVVAFAALTAVFVYPVLLRVSMLPAARMDRWLFDRVRRVLPCQADKTLDAPKLIPTVPGYSRLWARLGSAATRRPVLWGVLAAVLLLSCAMPLNKAQFGVADERVLPESTQVRQTSELVRTEFPEVAGSRLPVVLSVGDPWAAGVAARVDRYARGLSSIDGVSGVDTVTGSYRDGSRIAPPAPAHHRLARDGAVLLTVRLLSGSQASASERVLGRIRALPAFVPRVVGGTAARTADTKAELARRVPLAALLAGGSAFLVVLSFTGGLFVSIKTVVLAVLSLSAGIGCMVPVFQEGRLGMGGFTVTGQLEISMLLLTICIALGLSVDYEVFLLSRIKEQYRATGECRSSIVYGMACTGRLISASSLVVVITMSALAMSRITSLKLLGTGLAVTVLLDATLVRALLVPAAMQLAGRANWWLPEWSRRIRRTRAEGRARSEWGLPKQQR